MERYKRIFKEKDKYNDEENYEKDNEDEEEDLEEAFIVGEKPSTEGGKYIVKKAKGPSEENPKKYVVGWTKTLKPGVKAKQKGGMTHSQRQQAAKKAARTKKANPTAQKKAQKQAARTRKQNKK